MSAAEGVDLDGLKHRLLRLGVDVKAPGQSPGQHTTTIISPTRPTHTTKNSNKASKDLNELLERVNKADAVLAKAEHIDAAARDAAYAGPSHGGKSPRQTKKVSKSPTKPVHQSITGVPRGATTRTAEHMKAAAHTPLSSVLTQFKEAETAWAQEKARLRREALQERKRANAADLELKRLQRLAEHKALDVKALKTALKNRDNQLEQAQHRIAELEEAFARTQEEAATQLTALNGERDDLKALLLATLQRLETVDEMVHRTELTSASMQEKMRMLEDERLQALETAARARAEVSELTENRRKIQWQSKLLEKLSEVQLKNNKRKTEAIKKLLHSDAPAGDLFPGVDLGDGDSTPT